MAEGLQEQTERLAGVLVVLDDQDLPASLRAREPPAPAGRGGGLHGQADRELRAATGTVAGGGNGAAVQLDQAPAGSDRSPGRPGPVHRLLGLREQLEDARQHRGAIPMPVSLTRRTASCPSRKTSTSTVPPVGVNLMALSSMLVTIWARRVGSALTTTDSARSVTRCCRARPPARSARTHGRRPAR